jgi:ABC-type nitrate/sulfonate/bicarbonate transport system substrate-binding protein
VRHPPRSPAIIAAVTVAAAVISGCSSPARNSVPTLASQRHEQARAARRALAVGRGTATITRLPQVRLGLPRDAADATALAAIQLGYYAQQLGGHIRFQPVAYSSATAEQVALTSGHLDAAYMTPQAALTAWQATGRRLRIVSGAASSRQHTTPDIVLVMTQAFLSSHRPQASQILQAQVRAAQFLTTQPALGLAAVSSELTATGNKTSLHRLAKSLGAMVFTCDPHSAAILANAHLPQNTPGLFDLKPLNQILTTSGQPAVR